MGHDELSNSSLMVTRILASVAESMLELGLFRMIDDDDFVNQRRRLEGHPESVCELEDLASTSADGMERAIRENGFATLEINTGTSCEILGPLGM